MKKPNPPKLVTITVTTTITVIFWIFFTLYQVLTATPDPSVDPKLLEPILPELDSATLSGLKDKVFFEEGSFVFNPQIEVPQQTQQSIETTPTTPEEQSIGELSPTPTETPTEELVTSITPTQ